MFEDLIPELQPFAAQLLDVAGTARVRLTVTSTLRTHSQQARLYRSWLRGERHYPVAPPGTSAHEYGYAFDAVADPAENQADFGQVWRSWGGIWNAKDDIHFEFPGFSAPLTPQIESGILKAADVLAGRPALSVIQSLYPEVTEVPVVGPAIAVATSPFETFESYLGNPALIVRALYNLFH